MSETGWRPWLPEAIAALVVLTVGLVEAVVFFEITDGRVEGFAQALIIAVAVGLCRREPGWALGLVWGLGLFHVLFGMPIMVAEIALAAVFFGAARWGGPRTVAMGAVSVPPALIVAFVLNSGRTVFLHLLMDGSMLGDALSRRPTLETALLLVAMLAVAAPWPAGLAMRSFDGARASRAALVAAEEVAAGALRETQHVREIAQLRDQQTQLARDVHDVVGHSLAVILAQAESGQYIDDTERLKKTLQTIATSARSSLQDVRQVLSSTQDPTTVGGGVDQLDSLIDGVRTSGHEVVATEAGTPRPLPPETGAVAYRVFQEMLTNAIKHGRRDKPITVEREWLAPDDVRISVTNSTDGEPDGAGAGRGLDGMRRRLDAIGGRLDVRRADDTFTATATFPGGPS